MLESLHKLLSEDGLVRPDQEIVANLFLLRSTVCEVLVPGGTDLFVKVAPLRALTREYDAAQAAHEAYPRITPRPIRLRSAHDRDYLMMEKIDHVPATRRGLENVGEDAWFDFARLMLEGCEGGAARSADDVDQVISLARAFALLPVDHVRRSMEEWLEHEGAALVARLPRIPQHGDLAANNVGLRDGGIVVFDWEDYGRVAFPGFDLAIFVASLLRFNAREIIHLHLSEPRDRLGRLVRAFREKHRVTPAAQLRLVACALALFHRIKVEHGYSMDIIATVRRTLGDIWDFARIAGVNALPLMGVE